jgi:AraC family transcriptional regulator, regulatory protein of adaptative response / methylated-DNA-[protein]-cysteine methyltransferase
MNAPTAILQKDVTPLGADYDIVRSVIERISLDYRDQPSLDELAQEVGTSPTLLQKTFTRWAGLSPKAFLQAITLDNARRLLDDGMPLLDAAFELGMSGPGRLHDLFVTHEAMSPGDYKSRGKGLTIRYGWHESPFGQALIMATDRGLAGLAFADIGRGSGRARRHGRTLAERAIMSRIRRHAALCAAHLRSRPLAPRRAAARGADRFRLSRSGSGRRS